MKQYGWLLLGQIFLLITISYSTFQLLSQDYPWIILDAANLAFHEAGHMLFFFTGSTLHTLGGTIFQLALPVSILIYFLVKRAYTSVAFCLFWLGDNLINIAWYIKDATSMSLPLLGGGIHDWNFLLRKWGLLSHDQQIGQSIQITGIVILITSILLLAALIISSLHKIIRSK